MTLRSKSKVEVELEKMRNDRSYERSVETARLMASKSANYRVLNDLVQAEQIIEDLSYLKIPSPNQADRNSQLDKAIMMLRSVITSNGDYENEAKQFLVKAYFLKDRKSVKLDNFLTVDLKSLVEAAPKSLPRNIRLLAEFTAMKGLTVREEGSKSSKQIHLQQALELIQISYGLIFIYFQELDKKVINTISCNFLFFLI